MMCFMCYTSINIIFAIQVIDIYVKIKMEKTVNNKITADIKYTHSDTSSISKVVPMRATKAYVTVEVL
jgi:hypothetical protein